MQAIKVLLVDDHTLVREMLLDRLGQEAGIDVLGAARNGDEAIELAKELRPDVVVLDIDMPGIDCFSAANQMVADREEIRLLFLTAHTSDTYITQALEAGALGFLTKEESPARIVTAIQDVAENRAFFSEEVRERIVFDSDQPRLSPKTTRSSTLTGREMEVLEMIARGLSKKEIAKQLDLALKTVEKHCENMMSKLGIHDRVELARYAFREGIARP